MSDEKTRLIVRLEEGRTSHWCENHRPRREVVLDKMNDVGEMQGDCACCHRRFVSKFVPGEGPLKLA